MAQRPDARPPKVPPRITAAPAIRQIYWCDLWNEAQLPEFHKTRPVVIISYRNTLHGHCTVLPVTTTEQPENPWAMPLSLSPTAQQGWVVCNHLMTVATSRLSPTGRTVLRLPEAEFERILTKLYAWLPRCS